MKAAFKKIAVLFDMDGVIVDNTKYHILAWAEFSKRLGIKVTAETVKKKFLGRLGIEIVRDVLKLQLTDKELKKFDDEREAYYRKIFKSHIKPVKGLLKFLESLKAHKIKMALASSAPPANVKFVLARTKLKKYFHYIIDAQGVKKGKPNPDIFLKAAKKLKVKPSNCIVFEDAFHGIEAAKRAGMKVIALATSHKKKEISHANLVIQDFSQISLEKLFQLRAKRDRP